MHLLAAEPGRIDDGSEAIDLQQDPADIVFLSAADTELACLALALDRRIAAGQGDQGDPTKSETPSPTVRAANLMALGHPMSVDLWVETMAAKAKLVVVRLLGGKSYWSYGVEQLVALAVEGDGPMLAFLPGDAQPDAELLRLSTIGPGSLQALWSCWIEGGPDNAACFLDLAHALITEGEQALADLPRAVPIPPAGVIGAVPAADPNLEPVPTIAVMCYRALVLAGDLAPIEALRSAVEAEGGRVLALSVTSLKDPAAVALLQTQLAAHPPDVILNTTGFAVAAPGSPNPGPFAPFDCPVLQVVLSGGAEAAWEEAPNGLTARDIAMNVALPEVDGRILSRAVSFKGAAERHPHLQFALARHTPRPDRIAFVARLAMAWARLRKTAPPARRVALLLANYPNRDGRLGNGVGLDTPEGTVEVMRSLRQADYDLGSDPLPSDGDALIELVKAGVTNAHDAAAQRVVREVLPLAEYQAFLADQLPESVVQAVTARWGDPAEDPFFRADLAGFALPLMRFGKLVIGVQPARGYNIDPVSSYHDPALPPPHGYLAAYAWIRQSFGAHAVIHMGKHGNLEWLPGKALALAETCFPEAVLGPMPHIYPFIVNDPGEGTQAKRRAQAVIIDHLTPPLTRAETYGVLRDLEALVDEYYDAASVDPRRLALLKDEILSLSRSAGLLEDLGIADSSADDEALAALDNHLCELKELQIRDGLHVFGRAPEGPQKTDLLCALARLPRGSAPHQAGLTQALAQDLELGFDPLAVEDPAAPWLGPRPPLLADSVLCADPWRSQGDSIERLELLAQSLVAGVQLPDPSWTATRAVLEDGIAQGLAPALAACGPAETGGLLTALAGRFVPPGPSGAPTRGRPDVLPTGRNFYSVDTRTLPTPAAWTLGWKAASLLVTRHVQDQGDWPRAVVISAWGTANMRTGGDDIAQALALMGVRPTWDERSRRVTGFEILPATVLDRPRVDVTLRISGFFRDAFPGLVDLVDSAARAVAALEEPPEINPLAARHRADADAFVAAGVAAEEAVRQAGHRVFGAMPGAYGAGLQALIDERGWETDADLARAYVRWGGWAYGGGTVAEGSSGAGIGAGTGPNPGQNAATGGMAGSPAHGVFERRLSLADAVIQNQDNREHDLLDSDDYYQFEGGAAAAVRVLSGQAPAVYHGDTSRPDNPKIRTLEEEIARVVRARVVNPKWIQGVMRHGYKGAFEMAATVDYLFAFAATARAVKDHQFDLVCQAYLGDQEVRDFLQAHNPDALREMAERLQEALDRALWRTRRNDTHALLEQILALGQTDDPAAHAGDPAPPAAKPETVLP